MTITDGVSRNIFADIVLMMREGNTELALRVLETQFGTLSEEQFRLIRDQYYRSSSSSQPFVFNLDAGKDGKTHLKTALEYPDYLLTLKTARRLSNLGFRLIMPGRRQPERAICGHRAALAELAPGVTLGAWQTKSWINKAPAGIGIDWNFSIPGDAYKEEVRIKPPTAGMFWFALVDGKVMCAPFENFLLKGLRHGENHSTWLPTPDGLEFRNMRIGAQRPEWLNSYRDLKLDSIDGPTDFDGCEYADEPDHRIDFVIHHNGDVTITS